MSNPTTNAEALPEDLYQWSNGQALVATGSPFAPVSHNGKSYRIGQMNNAFVFPGIGLGIVASGATRVLPVFSLPPPSMPWPGLSRIRTWRTGFCSPPLDQLREVSIAVAKQVGAEAINAGVTGDGCAFSRFKHNNDPNGSTP